eukprot:4832483-Pleurochrysis_carterae.AAC.3
MAGHSSCAFGFCPGKRGSNRATRVINGLRVKHWASLAASLTHDLWRYFSRRNKCALTAVQYRVCAWNANSVPCDAFMAAVEFKLLVDR